MQMVFLTLHFMCRHYSPGDLIKATGRIQDNNEATLIAAQPANSTELVTYQLHNNTTTDLVYEIRDVTNGSVYKYGIIPANNSDGMIEVHLPQSHQSLNKAWTLKIPLGTVDVYYFALACRK